MLPLQRDGARFSAVDLPPGTYQLLSSEGLPPFDADVVVTSGATARLELSAAGSVGVELVFMASARDGVRHHRLELRGGPSGRVLLSMTWSQSADDVSRMPLVLMPGLYDVSLMTSDGLSGRSTLSVGSQPVTHDVHLR